MPPRSLTHEFAKAVARVKDVLRVRFHDPRQERLGHSTISTTIDLYSHVTNAMQGEAAAKLDTAFRSAINAAVRTK